jgi:hypothetical protein
MAKLTKYKPNKVTPPPMAKAIVSGSPKINEPKITAIIGFI